MSPALSSCVLAVSAAGLHVHRERTLCPLNLEISDSRGVQEALDFTAGIEPWRVLFCGSGPRADRALLENGRSNFRGFTAAGAASA